MRENKTATVCVRLNERQAEILQKMISEGLAETKSSAIQYLINKYQVLN
ncbi:hypothetical protein MXF13_03145 [Leclercia adecarboxylata]|nr:hypothetical protein [Leclercia adecarboxylata]MEB5748888.1 hypothetical protein [Leclercia adecarboxylata]